MEYLRKWEQKLIVNLKLLDSHDKWDVEPKMEQHDSSTEDDNIENIINDSEDVKGSTICINFTRRREEKMKNKIKQKKVTVLKNSKKKRLSCEICLDFVSIHKRKLERHMSEEHGITQCFDCKENMSDMKQLKQHRFDHHNKHTKVKTESKSQLAKLHCDSCSDFKTVNKTKLERHMFEVHEQTFCSDCGSNFTNFTEMKRHPCTTENEPVKCNFCEEAFRTERGLKYHLLSMHSVTDQDRVLCPHCGDPFVAGSLKAHIKYMHESTSADFSCSQCPYRCKRKADLVSHTKNVHTASNVPVACPWCGIKVKYLKDHLRRKKCDIPIENRKVQEKLKCDVCNKEFGFKHGLRRHMKLFHSNSGEKLLDHQCEMCAYKTYSKHNLYMHVKRMHEGKPLKETCIHCYTEVVNMEFHLKTFHPGI